MTTKLDLITAHVASRGWDCVRVDDATLRVDLAPPRVVRAPEAYWMLDVRAEHPRVVPPERRGDVMAYLTRANVASEVGAFELDLDAGTVAFRTGMWTRGVPLTHEIMLNLFDTNTLGYHAFARGIDAVIDGAASAEDALAEALENRG